ncbi:beta-N-acetylglucosaminidase domain-containing protein [Gilvimarinus chinensis]|uniref:beta-N-acetylglucosaminidase domain-containing protein n=1 Tax=Gilvimarinus chinensis TaxID=396005 RepID=UPI0003707358|nr:beta-N-acetylglucosaminidase domain-containing protein [Gilvimarinus chinensis]
MADTHSPTTGVLEGFFGRSWSWEQRLRLAAFMHKEDFDFYLYAPKSDAHLRNRWRQDWPADQWQALKNLRHTYHSAGIAFGLGLSPLDLCTPEGKADTKAFKEKITRINQLEPDWLGLFFDDMRGDIPDLAARQAELSHFATTHSSAQRIILCPTYYSTDPVLDKVFGARPSNYLPQLGRELDPAIQVFWSGPQVCSATYPLEHLQEITHLLQRKPFLWDNYPVNDGAVKSQHLYLSPPEASRFENQQHIEGIAANPMNQFALSLPALAGLAQGIKCRAPATIDTLLKKLFSQPLAELLRQDAPFFANHGLNELDENERQRLLQRYRPHLEKEEAAREVTDWLNGGYTFDPACLTE